MLQDLFSQEIWPLASFPCGLHHENERRSDSCGLGPKTLGFQHKSLSLGNSPPWLPRAGARPRVPSQFTGTYHSDSCSGVIYNHFVFASKKLKNVTYCGIPIAETLRRAATGDFLQTCLPWSPVLYTHSLMTQLGPWQLCLDIAQSSREGKPL